MHNLIGKKMSLIKLAANNEGIQKAKKYVINGLALTGIGAGLWGDALLLKQILKKSK